MRLIALTLLTLVPAALLSCRQNDAPDEATELLERVRDQDYTAWQRAPGFGSRTPSDAPHSDQVEIFVNDVVGDALAADEPLTEWPEGSIIVKDGYTDDGELALIAVMAKRSTGWFWAEYDADDAPLYSGVPDVCVDCHDSGSDFVRAFGF
jgi:hypothetical protein